MRFRCQGCLFILMILASIGMAQQELPKDSLEASRRLQELRADIARLESQIASSNAKAKDLSAELDQLDQNISLRISVINTLEEERDRINGDIERTTEQIQFRQNDIRRLQGNRSELQKQYNTLYDVVSRRVVYVYKHWNIDRWTTLLNSQSLSDLLSRQYYFRKLHHWDTKHLEELSHCTDSLESIERRVQAEREALDRDLQHQQSARHQKDEMIEQKTTEETALVLKKDERTQLLTEVRADKVALENQLKETQQAIQEIEKAIVAMESRRVPVVPPAGYFTSGMPFASLQGKLPWPVVGRVVNRFGVRRHPRLGTVTENTGIDIEASRGTPVRAVSDAQVGIVTWLRGFGNTVILDHKDGHYSVYAHLDQVKVLQGGWILAGDVIGTVGDTGSLEGPQLHFEIWNKRQIQDPELWLTATNYP
jgi:septal ring factor EnvC (AmiA/AmiB activator)